MDILQTFVAFSEYMNFTSKFFNSLSKILIFKVIFLIHKLPLNPECLFEKTSLEDQLL